MPDFIKDTFLKLTEYTIPHGKEGTLEKYLPTGIQKDSIGNYFIKIGQSETLFTTHLDTYSKDYVKINHIINGDIIKTDGATILGGDNKLGCTILLYMISKGIPGTYYFFLSEEPISPKGGRWGSLSALESIEPSTTSVLSHRKSRLSNGTSIFKKFKRCVAFDRKEKGSIVTRQVGRRCCSDEFADALAAEFAKAGMKYQKDHKAYYTDTATFIDTIPECTNLSAGGWREHYLDEWVDLSYTRQVAEAAIKINWEKLPVLRKVEEIPAARRIFGFDGFKNKITDGREAVSLLANKYDLLWTNKKRYLADMDSFLHFNTWFEDRDIRVTMGDQILFQQANTTKKVNSIKELDLFLNDFIGVPFDEEQLGLDGEQFVNIEQDDETVLSMSLDEYIEYFKKLNTSDTSYKSEGTKDQFTDYGGDKLTKEQFIKWLEQNELI